MRIKIGDIVEVCPMSGGVNDNGKFMKFDTNSDRTAVVESIEHIDGDLFAFNVKFVDGKFIGNRVLVFHNELRLVKQDDKWCFTDDEKVILKNLPEWVNYICRDANGTIKLAEVKPYKDDGFWKIPVAGLKDYLIYQHLFLCINWADEEPCEFRKYIGEER